MYYLIYSESNLYSVLYIKSYNQLSQTLYPIINNWLSHTLYPIINNWLSQTLYPIINIWLSQTLVPIINNWQSQTLYPIINIWLSQTLYPIINNWLSQTHYHILNYHKRIIILSTITNALSYNQLSQTLYSGVLCYLVVNCDSAGRTCLSARSARAPWPSSRLEPPLPTRQFINVIGWLNLLNLRSGESSPTKSDANL